MYLAAWAGVVLWALGVIGYFFSTQPWTGLFTDNQHTYFIQGLRLSGRHPYLELDWFAQTKPLHITFTYLVAGLERWGLLQPGIAFFDIAFRLVFLASCWLIVWALWGYSGLDFSRKGVLHRAALTLSVLTLLVMSLWPVFQLSAYFEALGMSWLAKGVEKFGFYYSFGGFSAFRYYTEPVSFSVLILTALAVLPYRRWRLAAVLLGVAALFHASFLLHTAFITGFLLLYLFFNGEKRTAFWVAGLYAVIVAPLAIYIITQMMDPFSAQANQILAQYRVPHHTLPARWWDLNEWAHTFIVALAVGLLVWRGKGVLRWLPAAITLYIALGIGYVALSGDLNVAILMPWRASGYLYSVAQLTVLTAGIFGIVKVLNLLHKNADSFVFVLSAALLCTGIFTHGAFSVLQGNYKDLSNYDSYSFFMQIREETPPDSLFIAPLDEVSFRLAAQRPVYVDWKSHPYKGEEVLEWWQRVQFVEAFYAPDTENRQQLCQSVGADYYLLQTAMRSQSETVVLANKNLVLVACP